VFDCNASFIFDITVRKSTLYTWCKNCVSCLGTWAGKVKLHGHYQERHSPAVLMLLRVYKGRCLYTLALSASVIHWLTEEKYLAVL